MDHPQQRDGTFSDVLDNSNHKAHPRVEFQFPHEEAEEVPAVELVKMLRAAVKVMTMCGVARDVERDVLGKAFAALANYLGVAAAAPTSEATLSDAKAIEDFILRPAEDGMSEASAYAVAMRYLVTRWFAQPSLFGDANQKEFGILLKKKAQIRCPNCAKRRKEIEDVLRRPSPAFHLRQYHGHWLDREFLRAELKGIETRFETTDMKKQSPNRIITEFRDRFGVKNGHMRQEEGRANMAAAQQSLQKEKLAIKQELQVIVNGQSVRVAVDDGSSVDYVKSNALTISKYEHIPPTRWQFVDGEGKAITCLFARDLPALTYLTLPAGIGA